MVGQEIGSRCIAGNAASWRNMIRCNRVTKKRQNARTGNVACCFRNFTGHSFEIRRVLNIGRPVIPIIGKTARCVDCLPFLGAFKHIGIA